MMPNTNSNTAPYQSESQWDADYTIGTWDYLWDHLEEGRYQAVLLAIAKYAPQGALLELGCGEGILQSRMMPDSYAKYVGIDMSKIAINKAQRLCNLNTYYQQADMETFVPESKFDAIVVNEALYYALNPVQLLKRYAYFLRPEGYIIISIFETKENRQLFDTIEAKYLKTEQYVSTNERGSWYCQVYSQSAII